jgi:hypothetical protein
MADCATRHAQLVSGDDECALYCSLSQSLAETFRDTTGVSARTIRDICGTACGCSQSQVGAVQLLGSGIYVTARKAEGTQLWDFCGRSDKGNVCELVCAGKTPATIAAQDQHSNSCTVEALMDAWNVTCDVKDCGDLTQYAKRQRKHSSVQGFVTPGEPDQSDMFGPEDHPVPDTGRSKISPDAEWAESDPSYQLPKKAGTPRDRGGGPDDGYSGVRGPDDGYSGVRGPDNGYLDASPPPPTYVSRLSAPNGGGTSGDVGRGGGAPRFSAPTPLFPSVNRPGKVVQWRGKSYQASGHEAPPKKKGGPDHLDAVGKTAHGDFPPWIIPSVFDAQTPDSPHVGDIDWAKPIPKAGDDAASGGNGGDGGDGGDGGGGGSAGAPSTFPPSSTFSVAFGTGPAQASFAPPSSLVPRVADVYALLSSSMGKVERPTCRTSSTSDGQRYVCAAPGVAPQ